MKLNNIKIQYDQQVVIEEGDFFASKGLMTGLVGESGSGKSSLLSIISLNHYHQDFYYFLGDVNLRLVDDEELHSLMKHKISFLSQNGQWIDALNCIDHILVECGIAGKRISETEAHEYLKKVNLEKSAKKIPSKLSGGEKQRLAIAMAMAKDADIIICDEITSALDDANTQGIISILSHLAHDEHKMVIIASHESEVIDCCDVVFEIENKKIHLVKSPSENAYDDPIDFEVGTHLARSLYSKVVFSRLKKRKWQTAVTFLLLAGLVASLSVTAIFFKDGRDSWKLKLANSNINELNVNNKTDPGPTMSIYSIDDYPFDQGIYDNIARIEGVDEVYPLFGFQLARYKGKKNFDNNLIKIKMNGQMVSEIEMPYNTRLGYNAYATNECVFPYYPEQSIQKYCRDLIDVKNGAYLTSYFANYLGIDKVEEGMTLAMDLFVTCAAYELPNEMIYTLRDGTSGREEYMSCLANYDKMAVEIPVAGILEEDYLDEVLDCAVMYLPYDMMMDYFETASAQHEMADNEFEFMPKNYRVYMDEGANREEIKHSISELSDTMHVIDFYGEVIESLNTLTDGQIFLITIMVGILLMSVFLLSIYSYFHKKDVQKDYTFFNTRGTTDKENKQMTMIEGTIIFVVTVVVSIIMSNIILSTVLKGYPFEQKYYYMIIQGDIIFSFIVTLLSEMALLV